MANTKQLIAAVGEPTLKYSFSDVSILCSPIVYALVRGEEILYIGLGTQGISRPLNVKHDHIRHMKRGDELLIWSFKDAGVAIDMEKRLIAEFSPADNGRVINKPYQLDQPVGIYCGIRQRPRKTGHSWILDFIYRGKRYFLTLGRGLSEEEAMTIGASKKQDIVHRADIEAWKTLRLINPTIKKPRKKRFPRLLSKNTS